MKKIRTKTLLKAVSAVMDYINGCMNHDTRTSLKQTELKEMLILLGRIEDDLFEELGIEQ